MKTVTLILALCLSATFIHAEIINVPAEQPTIQRGIDAAADGDTVLVADSIYYENIRFKGKAITVASHFLIDDDTSHVSATIIDGSKPANVDSASVVYFVSGEDTTSVLYGFTITGGRGTLHPFPARFGGGIACENSGAKIIHNHITNNHIISNLTIALGGGISAGPPGDTTWVVIKDNVVDGNSVTHTGDQGAGNGGGITVYVNVRLVDNTIENNTAQSSNATCWGGGVVLAGDAAQPLVRYCSGNTIRYNQALSPTGTANDGGVGGGLAVAYVPKAIIKNNNISYNAVQSNALIGTNCYGGGVILQNQNEETIFANNYVAHNKALSNSECLGAGLILWGGGTDVPCSPLLYNNIIADNTNGNWGGGIYIGGWNSPTTPRKPTLINNTITQNSALYGGAIYSKQSHPFIMNSILWDNGSSIYQIGGGVTAVYSNIEGGYSGEGNRNIDPLFVAGDSLFHLMSSTDTSMCLSTGIDSILINGSWYVAPSFDYGGNRRPLPAGTMPDMGAWESDVVNSLQTVPLAPLPTTFALEQNYPNPFNPSTTIEFILPKSELVKLKVYNLLGKKVSTLVSKKLNQGTHTYTFEAGNLASGVYYYQLVAGDYSRVKKMILLK